MEDFELSKAFQDEPMDPRTLDGLTATVSPEEVKLFYFLNIAEIRHSSQRWSNSRWSFDCG